MDRGGAEGREEDPGGDALTGRGGGGISKLAEPTILLLVLLFPLVPALRLSPFE